ncbi:GNAT family N-acetyltransferase [Mangrovimonas futianensis]|uniref:GNAT family N-acetyltransferase n=1 Tax=Mangrovimonas futianensis TaxID=2895523 RepID=UPI001E4B992B|nr:GNAT family N-acetyltransferase [Mangrovimonas futianensis]MCF1422174.1 GNAT family N-acetyltransferase [Mangrovimonas futianensis]
MIDLLRTDSSHPDFIELVKALDLDLALRDGEEHSFYAQFNGIDTLHHCLIFYQGGMAIGCGAFKKMDSTSVEIKRMYVVPDYRGKGFASTILLGLENWANEIGFKKAVLETGKKQPEAIQLYKKNGYQIIENYGPYQGIENSICFEKQLNKS